MARPTLILCMFLVAACGDGALSISNGTDAGFDGFVPLNNGANNGVNNGGNNGTNNGVMPGVDQDGDGIDDAFEQAAGNQALLDWTKADTDGNGMLDGAEDFDGDGLTVADEFAATRLTALTAGTPHPFRVDLLVELDLMQDRTLAPGVIAEAEAAYAALPTAGVSGQTGVGLHVYVDESALPVQAFDGSASGFVNYFEAHGPMFNDAGAPPLPRTKMIHVMVVTRRSDTPNTPAQALFPDGGGNPEGTGVLIYYDAIDEAHPACADEISRDMALAAALIHEVGHTLQLGHDTDVGGGVNTYNVMALASSCVEALERFKGVGNTNPALGATEAVGQLRFSQAAAALMDFRNKLSVEASSLVDGDGVEM